MVEVRKKENEHHGALIYRFTKKIQRSGLLKEAKKRRFKKRVPNRLKRKLSAIYRHERMKEIQKARKTGNIH